MKFELLETIDRFRRGRLRTAHGTVETPAYLPCATHGTVKTLHSEELKTLGFEILLSNTYHLYLRPGIEAIEHVGGLHQFMGWDRTILTDSGGFQAFSLGRKPLRSSKSEGGKRATPLRQGFAGRAFARTTNEGIRFRSHLDGSEHFFTPENVINYQERLGVDLATCLDVCTGFPETEAKVAWAVDVTNRWAERSLAARTRADYGLYGMVQGSIYRNLREKSAKFLAALPFDGYAIGGNMYTFGASLATLAHEKPEMWAILDLLDDILPKDKPRHLLGVGEPADIIEGVRYGIDTFDCVMATRVARNGAIWVWEDDLALTKEEQASIGKGIEVTFEGQLQSYYRINLRNRLFRSSQERLTKSCPCSGCASGLIRAWFSHASRTQETLASRLLSMHNLYFIQNILEKIRNPKDQTNPKPQAPNGKIVT